MRKILIFSLNYYPRFIGGAEVAIKEITDRISSKDIEFHLITLRFDSSLPKIERIGNVMVYRIGFTTKSPNIYDLQKWPLKLNKYYFQYFAARKAAQLHATKHFDALWAMMAHSSGVPASIFKKNYPNVPYLLTLQEGDPSDHIEHLMKPVWYLFTRAFKSADNVQAISMFLARWALRMGFKGKSIVIPNAVDTGRFGHLYSAEELASTRQELGKKEGDIFLVTTSRLVRKNAIDIIIRSLCLLPPRVSLLVYGIGTGQKHLEGLATELGVSSRVRFMGEISHEHMPRMLQACDIFVRPSRSEGMGNSFVEAMAAGLPVIATQVGGIADFLFDAELNPGTPATGWAVDVDSPEQVASAVEEILEHPDQTKVVTRTARAMVIEKYDWNTVAEQMRTLFNGMFKTRIQ